MPLDDEAELWPVHLEPIVEKDLEEGEVILGEKKAETLPREGRSRRRVRFC